MANVLGGERVASRSRSPETMADAALAVLSRPAHEQTGKTLVDADVLAEAGTTDLARYGGGQQPNSTSSWIPLTG